MRMISSSSTLESQTASKHAVTVTSQSPHYKRSEIKYSDAQVNSSHQHTDRSVCVLQRN